MNAAVMTPERLAWLRSVAEQSKRAERGNADLFDALREGLTDAIEGYARQCASD
jgi:hypothetical protein